MKLIWTKSNMPLSQFIRWGLDEPCSHFAVVFEDRVVFQSNLLGTNLEWFNYFQQTSGFQIVHEIDLNLSIQDEDAVWDAVCNADSGKYYDFGAFFYFAWCGLKWRVAGIPFPQTNLWSGSGLLCVGVAKQLGQCPQIPQYIRDAINSFQDIEIVSPERLWQKISAASQLGSSVSGSTSSGNP